MCALLLDNKYLKRKLIMICFREVEALRVLAGRGVQGVRFVRGGRGPRA